MPPSCWETDCGQQTNNHSITLITTSTRNLSSKQIICKPKSVMKRINCSSKFKRETFPTVSPSLLQTCNKLKQGTYRKVFQLLIPATLWKCWSTAWLYIQLWTWSHLVHDTNTFTYVIWRSISFLKNMLYKIPSMSLLCHPQQKGKWGGTQVKSEICRFWWFGIFKHLNKEY